MKSNPHHAPPVASAALAGMGLSSLHLPSSLGPEEKTCLPGRPFPEAKPPPPVLTSSPFLTLAELAARFRVSVEQTRRLAQEERFLALSIGLRAPGDRAHLRVVGATVQRSLGDGSWREWCDVAARIDDWLFHHRRMVLRPVEVADALRCSARHVLKLFEAGEIQASTISASSSQRQHLRIDRSSVVAFIRRRLELRNGPMNLGRG